MAGDWIKIEGSTPRKPEVMKVARKLGLSPDDVMGKLCRMWVWFDANSVDGVVDGVVDADVDALVDKDGFADALKCVGWLASNAELEQITMPNFDTHNGESAKKRALKNRRQQRWRDKNVDGPASTDASTREEKRREEKSNKNGEARKRAIPQDLTLTEKHIEYCAKVAPHADPEHQFAKFVANHKAKGTKHVDWYAAWQLWCRNCRDWVKPAEPQRPRLRSIREATE